MSTKAYIPSLKGGYSPVVNRGLTRAQLLAQAEKDAKPLPETVIDPQANTIFRAKPTVWKIDDDPVSKMPASSRPLSACSPDELRVLKLRYLNETRIRRLSGRALSAVLDVRPEDLHLLDERPYSPRPLEQQDEADLAAALSGMDDF